MNLLLASAEAAKNPDSLADRVSVLAGYAPILLVAFLTTLLMTPVMRRLALAFGVIDRPNESRKVHKIPIAYLGGAAVFLGIMGGIIYSFFAMRFSSLTEFHATQFLNDQGAPFGVPFSVLLGLTVITLIGLYDDVSGIPPRVKVGGQLLAAAALAMDEVGVRLAAGIFIPIANALNIPLTNIGGTETLGFVIHLPFQVMGRSSIPIDVIYWVGTALIAIAVLGLCNAANLIDGLDGLLSGTTAISAIGLLILSLGLAVVDDGPRDAQRLILCLSLLGACLGFLPHNFNPAVIFLGDCGSLLLGFCTCVIILTLGDTGKTHLVAAGLFIFAIPGIDMTLAIIRRKMAGKPLSAADDQHLHHMLKRQVGVKGAVLTLYALASCFLALGVLISLLRARFAYVIAALLVAAIIAYGVRIARRYIAHGATPAKHAKPKELIITPAKGYALAAGTLVAGASLFLVDARLGLVACTIVALFTGFVGLKLARRRHIEAHAATLTEPLDAPASNAAG